MQTQIEDDRTPAELKTHQYAVVAKDTFMSGWGRASNGASWCAWATETFSGAKTAADWVRNRKEMRFVRVKYLPKYRPPYGAAHFHIYVANSGHPALQSKEVAQ